MIRELARAGLLSPRALIALAGAVRRTGPNLAALVELSARRGRGAALSDGAESVSYAELAVEVEALARTLRDAHGVGPTSRVALLTRSSVAGVRQLLAVARLGADLTLLNPDASAAQVADSADARRFDLVLFEPSLAPLTSDVQARRAPFTAASAEPGPRVARARGGALAILTGGTTGAPKAARRRPAARAFVRPFAELIVRLDLGRFRSALVATPVHHGFGLAALMVGFALGQEMVLLPRFDAGAACAAVAAGKLEMATLVPTMLARMLAHDAAALASLRRVPCGGAPLDPALAGRALEALGPVLFNMYGTSEAGFCVMATPDEIAAAPESIGRPITGASLRLVGDGDAPTPPGEIGRLQLRCGWSTSAAEWIDTGDLARLDREGRVFMRGRADDLVVSGGEKTYPVDLERVLLGHPGVSQAAAIGVPDAVFGQRLKAFVAPAPGVALASPDLFAWLEGRIARYQKPAAIVILADLPLTALGKVNKRALRENVIA